MINSQFQQLCRDASLELQAPDVDRLAQAGHIDVDGIDLSMRFDEDLLADRIFCYMDMGSLGDDASGERVRSLLRMNLLTGAKTNGVFALDPESGNALFVVHLVNPDRFTGRSLANALRIHCAQARAGRDLVLEQAI